MKTFTVTITLFALSQAASLKQEASQLAQTESKAEETPQLELALA